MSSIIDTIRQDLSDAIEADQLVLPTLPEAALKVREIAESEDSAIPDLVEVVSRDAALSARLIRVTNSPLFRAARQIDNINMAISRLGMDYTANLAMGLAMEQMFQATSDMIDKRLREVWKTSTEVAGICHVLAQHYTNLKPDQATLAGLVHMIGALPILRYVEDQEVQVSNIMLDNLIDELHPEVGAKILEKWEFPKDIQCVPKEYRDFSRQAPKVDLADVVTVAHLQLVEGTGQTDSDVDWHSVTAFERMGLDPSRDPSDVEDLTEEMEAAMRFLQ